MPARIRHSLPHMRACDRPRTTQGSEGRLDTEAAKTAMWLALAFLFVVAGAGFGYAMWRVGRALRGVERDLHRTVDEVVPVIGKAAVSVDTVNVQLQKLDVMMDSAVDMTESLDTTVRALSIAVTEPVKKVSGAFAGVGGALSSFRERVTSIDDDPGDLSHATAAYASSEDEQ